ncbi:hypothetical protein BH24ACT12_BH24ACT12_07490 [soil metagenome]|jgi:cysteine synthase A
MPARTSCEKVELIEFQGGRCHLVEDPGAIYAESARLARECGGHYMDQFTHAERATDWRGNNNIAESIFAQLALERHPVPRWVVMGAGTGGTSATIGRYVRYQRHTTQIAVVDPEGSAFYAGWANGDASRTGTGSRIEGIGRPRIEPSFVSTVIDTMIQVPDAASIAAMRWCSALTGRSVGGFDRHQHVGRTATDRRHARGGRAGQRGDPAVRLRQPVRRHVLRRPLVAGSGD